MWVLETEPGSSGRTVHALSRLCSLPPYFLFDPGSLTNPVLTSVLGCLASRPQGSAFLQAFRPSALELQACDTFMRAGFYVQAPWLSLPACT